MGNHTTVTWNLALWHPAAVIGNGTVDQTSYRLTATEVGHVLVDAIACDLEPGYEHDGMPISPMRRTRSRLGVDLFLQSSSSVTKGQADVHDIFGEHI